MDNISFKRHRFDCRHPAALASASVQNQRSPLEGEIFVRL